MFATLFKTQEIHGRFDNAQLAHLIKWWQHCFLKVKSFCTNKGSEAIIMEKEMIVALDYYDLLSNDCVI